jgi:acetolactate synthase I/II/III large subunit
MKLTGGQVIGRALGSYGVQHVAAIPGHGAWAMLDALLEAGSEVPVVQVFHEQSAVHMADGYFRACGRPMAAMTSIGPGATNTIIGLATAYADSSSLILFTGGPASHMRGHGTMQELERAEDNAFPRVVAPVTKRHWEPRRVDELPSVMHRAFSAMLTGRPGPVHVEVPMDVQAESAEVSVHDLARRLPVGVVHPDPEAIARAADQIIAAERPVFAIGGGTIMSDASEPLRRLAELLSIPVVTTWSGKGAFPEDHALSAGSVGQTGSTAANGIAAGADLVIAIGCRFTDWSASSYRRGVTFSIPPARLIQIDLEPHEIGKNYPVEVGILADARVALDALSVAVADRRNAWRDRSAHLAELERLKGEWEEMLAPRRDSDDAPMTSQRPLRDLRAAMPRNGIIVAGSGNTQGAVKQTFPVFEPRTHLTSGAFSSMGWAVPASIGAKLACPEKPVACVVGDGDFMQTMQEIGVCVTNDIPVVFVVQNNAGYMSIRGGQRKIMGRHVASEFNLSDGTPWSPDFVAVARAFGLEAWRCATPDQLTPAFEAAFASGKPSLVEVATARDAAGPFVPGWWDFPVPAYIQDERQTEYWAERADEQHL